MSIPKSFADLPLSGDAPIGTKRQPEDPKTHRLVPNGKPWHSPEGIDILPVYGPEHLAGLDALDTWPGLSPFLRGPYPTMYTSTPASPPPRSPTRSTGATWRPDRRA
jgi:methylmalonyl-CoA mutase